MKLAGYGVRMKAGYWTGIWNEKETAERVRDKQPPSHGNELVELYELEKGEKSE